MPCDMCNIDPDFFTDDDDEERMPETCPNCGKDYDEIDYEYQICHICGYNNNPEK